MRNNIVWLLVFFSFFSLGNLHALSEERSKEEVTCYKEVTLEKMAVLKLLMNKDLMLTFVSHPKTREYFLREKDRMTDYFISLKPEVERLQRETPPDPAINRFCKQCFNEINILENTLGDPFPYGDLIIPFLTMGIADLEGIQDHRLVKKIQDFQIKLFKNYLLAEGVGEYGSDETKKIAQFSKTCSLPIFSQWIGPLLEAVLKVDGHIDDLVGIYHSGKFENLSDAQQKELEDTYDPPPLPFQSSLLSRLEVPEMFINHPEIENLEVTFSDEGFWSEETFPSEEIIIEFIEQKIDSQSFFSLERLFSVFFEVMIDAYPDRRAFFLNIQQAYSMN